MTKAKNMKILLILHKCCIDDQCIKYIKIYELNFEWSAEYMVNKNKKNMIYKLYTSDKWRIEWQNREISMWCVSSFNGASSDLKMLLLIEPYRIIDDEETCEINFSTEGYSEYH